MSDDNTHDALSPEQLELNGEHIQQLDENRYVVSFEAQNPPSEVTPDSGGANAGRTSTPPTEELSEPDAAYAFEARGRFETDIDDIDVETNDVSDGFESLLRWYARNVADDTPAEEVIAVLLANSELDVRIHQS